MLTFQPQSFQSHSLAVIFILSALQHCRILYSVLSLESSAFLCHILSNIPPSESFDFHLPIFRNIFTHQPLSPSSLVYPHGNINIHLSLLLHSFDSSPLYCFGFLFASLKVPSFPSPFSIPYLSWSSFHPPLLLLTASFNVSSVYFTPSWLKSCHRFTEKNKERWKTV